MTWQDVGQKNSNSDFRDEWTCSFREFLVRNFPTGLQGGLPKQGWRQVCLCLPKQAVTVHVCRAPDVYSTRNHLIKIFDKQDVIVIEIKEIVNSMSRGFVVDPCALIDAHHTSYFNQYWKSVSFEGTRLL
jgi:hypothetical protein